MIDQGEDRELGSPALVEEGEARLSQQELATALERIHFAIRQRTAERAVTDEVAEQAGVGDVPLALRQMWDASTFSEPMLRSHRRVLGRLVVFFKKVGFHLFAKWYIRPILEQQEAFNRAAFHAMRELYSASASEALVEPSPADPREPAGGGD